MKLKVKGNDIEGMPAGSIHNRHIDFPGLMFHAGPFTAFQTAPEKRLVHVKELANNRTEEAFEIITPWILYLVSVFDGQISNIWMVGSPRRITSLDQSLFRIPVPNVYRDGRFCMPREAVVAPQNTQELYETTLSIAWESYYNADLFSEFSRDVWNFPFFDYPDDLPDHHMFKRVFEKMLSPGDVFSAWEKRVTEKNLADLFDENMRVRTDYIKDEIPQFSARNIIAANSLQYMG